MRRREVISLIGRAAVLSGLLPFTASAQSSVPVIGALVLGGPSSYDLSGFRQGFQDAGFVEGQNLAVEYRWANDDPDRLPDLASDLVRRRVRVIVVVASGLAALAAKQATATIPIVFGYGLDPVQQGLVVSLNQPGGNITGVTSRARELIGKQFGLLHELLPQAVHVGILRNSKNAQPEVVDNAARAAASGLGLTVDVLTASTGSEIDALFASLGRDKPIQGLVVTNEPLFIGQRAQLADLAARRSLPTICPFREMTAAGCLLSYGPNLYERDREAGRYVGRILRGEKPADLPVQQMSKFELVINLRTAKVLGVTVTSAMQLLADDIIE